MRSINDLSFPYVSISFQPITWYQQTNLWVLNHSFFNLCYLPLSFCLSLPLCPLLTCVPTSINMRLGIVPQDCSFYNTHTLKLSHTLRTHESSFNLVALSHLWKQSHFGTPNKRCQFNLVLVPAGHMGHLKPLGTGTGYKEHKAACQTEHRKWLPCRPSCCVCVCEVLGVCVWYVCVCVWAWRQQVTSGIVKLKMA